MTAQAGFLYTIELRDREGNLIERSEDHNLLPVEGINHMLAAEFLGGAQVSTWYLGVYTNDYAPQSTDTMATFPGLAGEATAYSATTRVALVFGSPTGGLIDNSASKAELTFTSNTTVRGGFISSNSTKGSTSGVLASAVRFSSPKAVEAGYTLTITAGNLITSS